MSRLGNFGESKRRRFRARTAKCEGSLEWKRNETITSLNETQRSREKEEEKEAYLALLVRNENFVKDGLNYDFCHLRNLYSFLCLL